MTRFVPRRPRTPDLRSRQSQNFGKMSAFTLSCGAVSAKAAVATRKSVVSRKSAIAGSSRKAVVVSAGMTVEGVKPTGNRVLVIPDEAETVSAGGILLMSGAANTGPGSSVCGKIQSIGGDVTTVKAGDKVLGRVSGET